MKQNGCSTLKFLTLFCLFTWSSGVLPFQILILRAMLPAILQTYFIPYHPRWWFSYSFCFYIWILGCDILVIPVPRLSCAAWAWFATCLLYQLLSFSWERATEGGSSQFWGVFLTLRQQHSYRPSVFLCWGLSLFFQYFFPLIAIYIDFWIGFESAANDVQWWRQDNWKCSKKHTSELDVEYWLSKQNYSKIS